MVALNAYSKNIKVKYKTFLLSKATFVVLLSGAISAVVPFVLAFQTGGFWQKRDVVYEQPEVTFKGDYLFVATTADNVDNPVICSSVSYYKKFLKFLDICSLIKIKETDENHDGKIDSLHVMLNFKVAENTRVSSLYLVLPLDYKLSVPCSFQMQTAIIYQKNSMNLLTSKLSIFADLHLEQLEPLVCSASDLTTNYQSNIPLGQGKDVRNYELEEIITKFSQRNIKTILKNELTTFNPTKDGTFTISLRVKYPEHKIYFRPRFWQILKFAWVQYFSLYVVISCIMFQIKRYIFENNLVLLYKQRSDK